MTRWGSDLPLANQPLTVRGAAHLTGSRVLELILNFEPPQPTADDETVAEGMTPVRLVTAANRPRLPLAC